MSIEVVKLGSSSVFADGSPRLDVGNSIASQIAERMRKGSHIALVSSGAIAFGRAEIGINPHEDLSIEDKQWLASIGQIPLMNFWGDVFENYGLQGGQVLTTNEVLLHQDGKPNENFGRTITKHFKRGTIPILNENDSVATEEISQGDNDKLGALVANAIGAEVYYLLGTSPHLSGAKGKRIKSASLDKDKKMLKKYCKGTEDPQGTGGAITKYEASKVYLLEHSGGISRRVVIAGAHEPDVLRQADRRHVGTTVVA